MEAFWKDAIKAFKCCACITFFTYLEIQVHRMNIPQVS